MKLTKDESAKLFSNLNSAVLQHNSPEHLLLNWLRDHQGEEIQFCTKTQVDQEKELLREALAGLVGLAERAGMDTHGFVIHAKRFLLQSGVVP